MVVVEYVGGVCFGRIPRGILMVSILGVVLGFGGF